MLFEVRTFNGAQVGRLLALSATVAEWRVYTFVKQFWVRTSCPALAFEVLHEAV